MMIRTRFPERHPYLFSSLLVLAIIVTYIIAGILAAIMDLPTVYLYLIANFILAVAIALIASGMQWWKEVGFRALAQPRDLWLFAVPAIPVLTNLLGFKPQAVSGMEIFSFFLLAALVGFVEETAFRGLMLRAIAPHGAWRAAAVTSVLFGILHSLNLLAGADVAATLWQIGIALAIGFAFAATALRTQVIWPLVIIHFLIDFIGLVSMNQVIETGTSPLQMIVDSVLIVCLISYSLVLLRSGQQLPVPANI